MNRDNDTWVAQLSSAGAEREVALTELRVVLFRNLRKALAGRPHVDNSFLEDAVQDALLRILDRLDQFQGRSRFVTWATSIAIRVALGELRRSRWKDVSLDSVLDDTDYAPTRAVDSSPSPELLVQQEALFHKLHELIETALTEKQRAALLAELRGMPQDEIARHLGSNRNALYKLTHDARKKLKSALQNAGYREDELELTY
ncbi:RNA polymerase sigma factor [Bythopirellula polymerisocia]|uniref:ECF RNA polymerase sigma-E factor n=1 Tax=Bythopirellula polymerisocia TaxID=2528003 RepID=A0A5C6CCE6_9BACT|nr:sigma-70 family RNA polymerase sigma factor [Bythopirellula polymerisocia]TWU21878.1 ECF RNA polymerase sigma-E factor [Bythopirellula polymerisocia]